MNLPTRARSHTANYLLALVAILGLQLGCDSDSPSFDGVGDQVGDLDASLSSSCTDSDGDGFGLGCQIGDDCDDTDMYVHAGATELCNMRDDNCDGQIDEDQVCAGEQCTPAGGTPADEDDDGAIDEGCPCEAGATRTCCGLSVQVCSAGDSEFGGYWSECSDDAWPQEVCDTIDNDCDGEIDEGCECTDGDTQPCGSDVGACEFGVTTCEDGHWSACSGGVGPADEFCNGIDDDCNGAIDDGSGICATTSCDELPPTLGGYRVIFDAGTSRWAVQTDGAGNPIKVDGTADTTASCTLQTARVESGQFSGQPISSAVGEVFFQVVGAGGGGGRHWEPPSTGGGAGAYVRGIVDLSGAAGSVQLSATGGVGGGVVAPSCSEDACNFTCTCARGAGSPGTSSSLVVDGITITAGGGAGGTWGVIAPGGTYNESGSSTTVSVQLNDPLSAPGNQGGVGPSRGHSGTGGSPACSWGTGAGGNQSGHGYGAGGGGGNNSPAGHGGGGLVILMWTECM